MKFFNWAFSTLILREKIVLLAFLAAVVVVYVWAGAILLGVLVRRRLGGPKPVRPRWRRICRACVLSLAAVGLLCVAYARFVEPFWPEVSEFRVETPRLAKCTRPIRIVHISDLHCDPTVRLEERLPEIIAALKPDLIVFTGDAVNSDAGIPNFRRCMSSLAAIAPTYAVRGNWDICPGSPLYAGTGAVELIDQVLPIQVRGTTIYLVGIAWAEWSTAQGLLKNIPPGAPTVMIYHSPDIVDLVPNMKVDLLLTGHTHGGQIALPFYGAMVTLTQHGKKYESGMYQVNGTAMHVSRGIGMEGGHVPRMRFFARPDVSLIELAPK